MSKERIEGDDGRVGFAPLVFWEDKDKFVPICFTEWERDANDKLCARLGYGYVDRFGVHFHHLGCCNRLNLLWYIVYCVAIRFK